MLQWTIMAGEYWTREQGRKAGLDHLYPYERSWMAAAFTLTDMIAAYDLIRDEMPESSRECWLQGMHKAARHLIRNNELHGFISNHRMAAAAALLGAWRITGEAAYRKRGVDLLATVMDKQSSEGFFLEYEGADPGYETLGLHYVSRAIKELGDARHGDSVVTALAGAAVRSIEFLSYFVHPDGGIGGEYGSRGCPHFFPGGVEFFSTSNPLAEAVTRACCAGLAAKTCSGLHDSDERNEVPLATSYVWAHSLLAEAGSRPCVSLPWEGSCERHFPEAGLYVHVTRRYQLVFGASRGGVLRIYDKSSRELAYSDYGYSARIKNGVPVASFHTPLLTEIGFNRKPSFEVGDHSLTAWITTPFCAFDVSREMSTPGLVAFRLFSLTFGRVKLLSNWVRCWIVTRHVTRKRPVDVFLRRTLAFESNSVAITDMFETGRKDVERLRRHGFFATSYMASARYFRRSDLGHGWSEEYPDFMPGKEISKRIVLPSDDPAT